MYVPFLRGKQFELLGLRDSADVLAGMGAIPVIEPVRETLSGLDRALRALVDAGGQAMVVVNPHHGQLKGRGNEIEEFLTAEYGDRDGIRPALLLQAESGHEEVSREIRRRSGAPLALVHDGFAAAEVIVDALEGGGGDTTHVFIEEQAGMLYRRRFADSVRVLLRDGFETKRNSDYGAVDFFSDRHITYADLGADGYGDFLTIGDAYSDSGGPAYAVAIHLTFIDSDRDGAMFVRHFVSDSNETPTDPAGKFREAVAKLALAVESGESGLLQTSGLNELLELHRDGHFPGLGVLKKLSMVHHIETLEAFERGEYA